MLLQGIILQCIIKISCLLTPAEALEYNKGKRYREKKKSSALLTPGIKINTPICA